MDTEARRARLVAAATVLRTVVHAQRATWCDDRQAMPAPYAVGLADVWPPAAVASGAPDDALTVAVSSAGALDRVTDRLAAVVEIASHGLAIARRWWRESLVAVLVFATVGSVRLYWPGWKGTVTSELAAGRRVVTRGREQVSARMERAMTPAPAVQDARPASRYGRLQVQSNPDHARVVLDGHDRGATPLTFEQIAPGSHAIVLKTADGSVRRTVTVAAGQTTQVNEAIFSGWLHVSSPVEVQISEGRQAIKLDDSNQALLPPGTHNLRFENRALGFRAAQRVDIRPGETASVVLEPPDSPVTITSTEPADVLVDGEAIGETPLVDAAVKIGTRDFTIRSKSGAIRHVTVTVTVEPARVDVDFSRP